MGADVSYGARRKQVGEPVVEAVEHVVDCPAVGGMLAFEESFVVAFMVHVVRAGAQEMEEREHGTFVLAFGKTCDGFFAGDSVRVAHVPGKSTA